MVGKCSHYASLLCLLILLLTLQAGRALFDIGRRATIGTLGHGFPTPSIPMSGMKHGSLVTFPHFLNPTDSQSIQTSGRRNWSMLCATFIDSQARMQPPIGLLMPLSATNPHRLPSTVARDDEHLLVAAAKRGDVHAFEELVNRYEAKIFRLTMNITRNREDAEDAMQDAFLKSYAHLKDFHEDSRFYTWLVRITANEALMRLRKRRANQLSLTEPVEGDADLLHRPLED